MSHIAHNCTCGHLFDLHVGHVTGTGTTCSTNTCPCRQRVQAESTVMESHTVDGTETPIERPGGPLFGMAMFRSCDCGECVELFNQLAAS